jgi:hypothetical protein
MATETRWCPAWRGLHPHNFLPCAPTHPGKFVCPACGETRSVLVPSPPSPSRAEDADG